MISRTSSMSSTQLRRTKSTSSGHLKPTRSLHVAEPLGPHRQHLAVVAAHEAFQRANCRDGLSTVRESHDGEEKPPPIRRSRSYLILSERGVGHFPSVDPPVHRRKSNNRGSEGSSTTTGLVRATSLKRTLRSVAPGPKQRVQKENAPPRSVHKEPTSFSHTDNQRLSVFGPNRVRESKSTASWDTTNPPAPREEGPPATAISLEIDSPVEPSSWLSEGMPPITVDPMLRTSMEDQIIQQGSAAREHRKSLRSRASSIFIANKRLVSSPKSRPSNIPTPVPLPQQVESRKASNESKKAPSFKSRMKSYFQKSSTAPYTMPLQQVEACRHHYLSTNSRESNSEASVAKDVILQKKSQTSMRFAFGQDSRPSSPARSIATMQSKSRVTSWADSTVAGTVNSNTLGSIMEDEPPKSSEQQSASTGRGFFRKLIRRPNPVGSRPSSALDSVPENALGLLSHPTPFASTNVSELLSLQRPLASTSRRTSWFQKLTVRAVTPDPGKSPEDSEEDETVTQAAALAPESHTSTNRSLTNWKSGNRLQKKPSSLPQQVVPSNEQISARVEKSETRWHTPLEANRSVFFPNSPSGRITPRRTRQSMEESPLRPRPQTPETQSGTFPRHEPAPSRALGTLSPSIYSNDDEARLSVSRDTSRESTGSRDGAGTGTAVGHVPSRKVRPSQDWHNWLSREMGDARTTSMEPSNITAEIIPIRRGNRHIREKAEIVAGNKSFALSAPST